MALRSVKGSTNIPEGAVRVTKEEALAYQRVIIRDWPKETEVLFLRYGGYLAGAITFATTIPCWTYFRPLLNLGRPGKVISFISGTAVPSISVAYTFDKYVTQKSLLKSPDCPLCQILPNTAYQLFQGCIYPTCIGFISGTYTAILLKTVYVPDITQFPEFVKFVKKLMKPGLIRFQIIGAIQLAVSIIFPYLQVKELVNITQKLKDEEDLALNS